MINESDVIVFDQEYTYAAKQIKDYCAVLVELMESYNNCINDVLENAIKDKKITEKLQGIVSAVEEIKPSVETIGEQASDFCGNFVSEIDIADKFLY